MLCILNREICVKCAPRYMCMRLLSLLLELLDYCDACTTEARFWSIKPKHSRYNTLITFCESIWLGFMCHPLNDVVILSTKYVSLHFKEFPIFQCWASIEPSNFQSHFSSVCYILHLYGTLSIEFFCSIICFCIDWRQSREWKQIKIERMARRQMEKGRGDNNAIAKIITVSNFHFETRTNNSFSIVKIDIV